MSGSWRPPNGSSWRCATAGGRAAESITDPSSLDLSEEWARKATIASALALFDLDRVRASHDGHPDDAASLQQNRCLSLDVYSVDERPNKLPSSRPRQEFRTQAAFRVERGKNALFELTGSEPLYTFTARSFATTFRLIIAIKLALGSTANVRQWPLPAVQQSIQEPDERGPANTTPRRARVLDGLRPGPYWL